MNKTLESFLSGFDVEHLRAILGCFRMRTSGNKSELVDRVMKNELPGLDLVLFFGCDKIQLQYFGSKLGLKTTGTKDEIRGRILEKLNLGDQYQAEYDVWRIDSEGLHLYKVDVPFLLDRCFSKDDLKVMCDNHRLHRSGEKDTLIERLTVSGYLTIENLLRTIEVPMLVRLADDLKIGQDVTGRANLIRAIETCLRRKNKSQTDRFNLTKIASVDFHYDVAISYAGEQRAIAESIAESLRTAQVKVFFDQFEKLRLWGKDLGAHFQDVYSKQARYCIMLISQDYKTKAWPNHERTAAVERYIEEHGNYILPILIDPVWVDGLPKTIHYLEWQKTNLQEITDAVLQRVRV